MTKIEYALEHPASVKDDTVFSEVTYYLLHSIEAAEGLEKLKLTARLEEIKCTTTAILLTVLTLRRNT